MGASTGPGSTVVPVLLCEFQRENPGVAVSLSISDTQSVVDRVAERELELGVVGAARRHRGVVFEPFFRDEVVLACPPGHRFAGRTISLDQLREEPLIVMQEGAGVRQVIEDELRRAGTRLRDLEPRLELGLQESVKSAVAAGHGVTFISRAAIEADLAAGTLETARVKGLDPAREISVVRSAGRSPTRAAEAFLEFARAAAVIVRWGLDELAPLLAELGIERPFLIASERWSGLDAALGRPLGRGAERPGARGGRGRLRGRTASSPSGGGSAIDLAKAISAATGLGLVSVPTTYSGAEWTTFFGVRDPDRRMKGGGVGAHLAGIVYEPELTLGLLARTERWHGPERARARRRGALRHGPEPGG